MARMNDYGDAIQFSDAELRFLKQYIEKVAVEAIANAFSVYKEVNKMELDAVREIVTKEIEQRDWLNKRYGGVTDWRGIYGTTSDK